MEYAFKALNDKGAKIEERVNAESEDDAVRSLQGQGYVVLSLAAAAPRKQTTAGASRRPLLPRWTPRVKLEQVAALSRELAIMIRTGVPITEALTLLVDQADSVTIKEALIAIRAELSAGKAMAESMGDHPRVFPKLYVNMVATAEVGGSLDETLSNAADYLEASLEMRRKVIGALTYPIVLMFAMIAVVIFMITFLIPKFADLFNHLGTPLPANLRFLLALSAFLRLRWWAALIGVFGAGAGLRAFLRSPAGNASFTKLLLRVPVMGDTIKKVVLARVLRGLGTLLGTGVSMMLALNTTAQLAQNVVYEQAILRLRGAVEEGSSLTDAARDTGVFPGIVCQMIAVGEKSGQLNVVLMHVAVFYEKDVDARLKALSSVIEPVMIVMMGVIVGFIAISLLGPMFSIYDSIK